MSAQIKETKSRAKGLQRGLDAAGYLRAHEAFRSHSNQREQMHEWFERRALLKLGGAVPAVLSVGCGGGDIDCELIRSLDRRGVFCYDAVDPSLVALELFRKRCGKLGAAAQNRVWLYRGLFEAFEAGHRYDLIHFVHALYALRDLRVALQKAYRHVGEGGKIAFVCSTDEGINAFKREVFQTVDLPGRAGTVREAEMIRSLAALDGAAQEIELIPSAIAVDACFEGTPEGQQVLSFCLQADYAALTPEEQDRVLSILAKRCYPVDGALYLSQPMLGVVVHKRAPVVPRRVRLNVAERDSLGALADVACFA